mmetsp:Transcript_49982/g.142946  ORF Transcript_49982/g.142946 Transcript_49982/m.142946 type:complete len:468 (+) Transcript_49982:1369-2772(+)
MSASWALCDTLSKMNWLSSRSLHHFTAKLLALFSSARRVAGYVRLSHVMIDLHPGPQAICERCHTCDELPRADRARPPSSNDRVARDGSGRPWSSRNCTRRPLAVSARDPLPSGWSVALACLSWPGDRMGTSTAWIILGLTQPCRSSTSASELSSRLRHTWRPSAEAAMCLREAGKRGMNFSAPSSCPRTTSTPSSPPLSTTGPQWARDRTGLACQCHLAGTWALSPDSVSKTFHQVQTTPRSSPTTTQRPWGSTESAVTRCSCCSSWLSAHPSFHTRTSLPSERAAAPAAASKAPPRSASSGTSLPSAGAPSSDTWILQTRTAWSSSPTATSTVSSRGHLRAYTGLCRSRLPSSAAAFASQTRTSPLAEPLTRGSEHPFAEQRGPAHTAVTREPCAGCRQQICRAVFALKQKTEAPQGAKTRAPPAERAARCSARSPLSSDGCTRRPSLSRQPRPASAMGRGWCRA